jgi:DNA (cytosine-5)-methyltransferase 1
MNVLDLFSGIGGFSLGLERAGMRTVQFCEVEPYCQAVLRKHWPEVPCHGDIRTLDATGISVDVVCGGFPCQDVSFAGGGAGLAGERSGLWFEFARIIKETRPRYAIIENVSALRSRGLDQVLGSLAALGYDAEWHCIPASAVGAPHQRDRIWVIAYPHADGELAVSVNAEVAGASAFSYLDEAGQPDHEGRQRSAQQNRRPILTSAIFDSGEHHWLSESPMVRVVHGVSRDVDAVGALGNSVVPQIPEIIGRAIMTANNTEGVRNAK